MATELHSILGASSAKRWMNCPGSIKLIASLDLPNTSSAYADEGTRAHAVAESCLRGGESRVSATKYGLKPTTDDIELTAAVNTYLADVWAEFGKNKTACTLLIEHKFHLTDVSEECFGTCDAVLYNRATAQLFVWDYKHGAGVRVDAENNPQLLYYALGALKQFEGECIEEVILTIVQPRCECEEGPIRRWSTDMLELLAFEDELKEAVEATKRPDAPHCGGDWCRFCPAKALCPQLERDALALSLDEFGDVFMPDPSAMTPEELARRLDKVAALMTYARALKAFAFAEAERGRAPNGWGLKPKMARRKWTDEDKARAALRSGTDSFMWGEFVALKSCAQIEKLLGKKHFENLAGTYVSKESSGNKLVKVGADGATIADPFDDFSE
jgi:hypothetical protein